MDTPSRNLQDQDPVVACIFVETDDRLCDILLDPDHFNIRSMVSATQVLDILNDQDKYSKKGYQHNDPKAYTQLFEYFYSFGFKSIYGNVKLQND